MVDPRLKFSCHVDYLVRKIMPKLKSLGQVRNYVGVGTSIYLFKRLIALIFSFCDFIYESMGMGDSNHLQVLHNNCLRACLRCDRLSHRTDLYERTNTVPLQVERMVNPCGIVYAGLNQMSSDCVNNCFTKMGDTHQFTTRSSIREE